MSTGDEAADSSAPPITSAMNSETDLVRRVLGLEVDAPMSFENLHQAVEQAIARVISDDFGRLASLLYQLDVDERAVEEAFASVSAHDLPKALSDLVVERLVRKLETRRRYRSRDAQSSDNRKTLP